MATTKRVIGCSLVLVLMIGFTPATAGESDMPNCPVMGEPIDLKVSTATETGPVFFCCKGCVKRYNANPSKYAKDVAKQRAFLAKRDKVQVTCPVTGEAVDHKTTIQHEGKTVAFCCKGCVSKFKNDPSRYRKNLANSYTFQTKCPVMDEEIDPAVFTTLASGQNIYYCCKGCEKRMLGNPEKYAARLASQGFGYSPKELVKKGAAKSHEGHDHSDHDHGGHGGHNHGG